MKENVSGFFFWTQCSTISYWWLIVNVEYYLPSARYFRVYRLKIDIGERPEISTYSIHCWKVYLVGYNSVKDSKLWVYLHSLSRTVVASQICEIAQNSEKIQTYSSSRSFTVMDHPTHVWRFTLGEPIIMSGWNLSNKIRGTGLLYGENCIIPTVFDWSIRVMDRETIAYCALCIMHT